MWTRMQSVKYEAPLGLGRLLRRRRCLGCLGRHQRHRARMASAAYVRDAGY